MVNDANPAVVTEALVQIVQSVFEVMTGLAVIPCEAQWFPSRERLTAAVQLAGNENRTVFIECDRSQARRLAGRFLSANLTETDDSVVTDVLGELANMIGGNLKCFLNRGLDLSMPAIVDGSEAAFQQAGAEVLKRLAFENGGDVFWITVSALPN